MVDIEFGAIECDGAGAGEGLEKYTADFSTIAGGYDDVGLGGGGEVAGIEVTTRITVQ